MPVVAVLRRIDDCPIYYRNTMTKALAKYETIYCVGGSEAEIKTLAPNSKLVLLSGSGRLESAVAVRDWIAKNR